METVLSENKYKKICKVESEDKIYIKKYFYHHENMDIYLVLKGLQDTHFPIIYKVETIEDGFIVEEEYIEGKTLQEILPIQDYSLLCDYGIQICEALKVLHKNDVIHRDLKPTNVMVADHKIKIIDFDIARVYVPRQNNDTQVLGSVGYAAPEQFGFDQSDAKTDFYSLGCLLNEMATGFLPHVVLDKRLSYVIKKCVQIDKDKRFKNENEIIRALHRVENNVSIYTLPGFREGILWHKILASLYYLLFIFLAYRLEVEGSIRVQLREYFLFILMYLLPFMFATNYMDIQDLNPLKRFRILGYVILFLGITLFYVVFTDFFV